ncbi:1-deoxy-D-xylulose-5-phosphate synthase [Xylanibacter oryzae]|uniref:1-deoxy-D-xylulose-5-phosphate synthase n=1 Tax=Xylanibacter oryzae TaxID=185293 RepID=UPI0004B30695|nr:1-deoxy-D-xylulose-5-phosphate synthase [Xylanibacter oryzae]
MYIERIESPSDVKKLSVSELEVLKDEVRATLLKKLSEHGGHIGPNLGMVEATIALHYVFNSPIDKIVYDVSHQSYVHKMITGRKEAFLDPEKYDDTSGYSEPSESEHDFFVIGHTSTSVSLATGLAKARDLKENKENIIAVIGDGSLSGGEAYEGLNNAAELGSNIIILVNDNQMSIAENHGGMYQNLQLLRDTEGKAECNFFKTFGFDYLYVKEGNNVESLIEAFQKVKDIDHPVVVHINTVKGKGYKFAEENKERFHAGGPFDLETGKPNSSNNSENYSDLTAKYLLKKMKEDKTIVVISSATPTVLGFNQERRKQAGKQFLDVGIAEEHAVAMASGLAANGAKPVYGVISTFIQRAYDQLSQDLCINNNSALILVYWASISSMNDVTHLGIFDIPLLSNIPNMVYLAPTNKEEYFAMMEWGIKQTSHPVAIRVPYYGGVISTGEKINENFDQLNRYRITKKGSKVAILGLGSFYQLGESVIEILKKEAGISATLINPRYITGMDVDLLNNLKKDHSLVVTLEDGALDGGFGEKIARYYGADDMKVLNFGIKKEFIDRYSVDKILKENHLTAPQIVADILNSFR